MLLKKAKLLFGEKRVASPTKDLHHVHLWPLIYLVWNKACQVNAINEVLVLGKVHLNAFI